jgi:hypothetical protein
MKRHAALMLALGFVFAVVALGWAAEASKDVQRSTGVADPATQIAYIQKERIEVLQNLVDVCVAQFNVRAIPLESVVAAQNEFIDAKLELTDKPEERVALLTSQLIIALKIAETVSIYGNGRYATALPINEADILRAKSHYLAIKIKLLQEQGKLKANRGHFIGIIGEGEEESAPDKPNTK